MKYLPLVWAGIWRTPLRTALIFLSIATTFLLFGTLYGVNAGPRVPVSTALRAL